MRTSGRVAPHHKNSLLSLQQAGDVAGGYVRRRTRNCPFIPTAMQNKSCKTLIRVIDRILSESDPLIAKIKATATGAVTDAEIHTNISGFRQDRERGGPDPVGIGLKAARPGQ